jgi:hypothetical protein
VFSCKSAIILARTVLCTERNLLMHQEPHPKSHAFDMDHVPRYAFERETKEVRDEEAHSFKGSSKSNLSWFVPNEALWCTWNRTEHKSSFLTMKCHQEMKI